MTFSEDILLLRNNTQEDSQYDWLCDINYKKKLNQLMKDLCGKDYMITHMPNGSVDAYCFKTIKVRYSWCPKFGKFIRSPRSNNRHYKNNNKANTVDD